MQPAVVIFIGFWARNHGGAACELRGIPYKAINRDRNPTKASGNRDDVVDFIKEHIGPVYQSARSVPISRNELGAIHVEAINPKRTLEILNKLQSLGLADKDFLKIHHSARESISGFRAYCEKTSEFQPGGTNERVHQRLQFILENYCSKGSRLADTQEFAVLATTALKAIPMK